eukprot:jgi/Galph1/4083/GphlegSOOS_G2743.1
MSPPTTINQHHNNNKEAFPMIQEGEGVLSMPFIEQARKMFLADPTCRLAKNAITRSDPLEVLLEKEIKDLNTHAYNHHVSDHECKATAQKASGRCWLFAFLNVMRLPMTTKYKLPDDFQLSQSYLFFWDKLERSNYFLESILETINEPVDSRLVSWLLSNPVQDGGQWDMICNLVNKYGVVPGSVYQESYNSSNSRRMNLIMTTKLREYAMLLRRQAKQGATIEQLRKEKERMLTEVYRIITICLGVVPSQFDWQFQDKDRKYHCYKNLTPHTFYRDYVGYCVDDKICLVHDPRPQHPYGKLYTVDYLGNMVSGERVRYNNQPIEYLKACAVESIKNGEAVWFGCDVGKFLQRQLGYMDLRIFDYELVFGTSLLGQNKAERLEYGESQMTHAMVLTAVCCEEDKNDSQKLKTIKWRVENSWGDELGEKGYFMMTDEWFDEFVYEVVVDKKYVKEEVIKVMEQEPIHLPPWDPFGALA